MDIEITTHRLADSGIGRAAGYESDEAFRAAVKAERAALPADIQEALREADRAMMRKLMHGDG